MSTLKFNDYIPSIFYHLENEREDGRREKREKGERENREAEVVGEGWW